MIMIETIIKTIKRFINASIFMDDIVKEQREFRKDHVLDPYGSSDDWRDEYLH